MTTATDILFAMEEKENYTTKELVKKLAIPVDQLERILRGLSEVNLVEYDVHKGIVELSSWLANLNKEIKNIEPAVGTIILPKNQEVELQDIIIGNFTDKDIELAVRLSAKQKELSMHNTS